MSSKDTRIVELQFDNKAFESGVESTIKSLDKLDKNLDNIDGKSLKNLNDAVKDVNFRGMEDSLSSLSDKFSAMGQIAQGIFRGIGEDVYNLGKQVIGNTVGQVISGGKSRALNIAQAEFMFEGVVGAENIEQAMDNASAAVDGTAYGLDEAAIAASQLAASGVQLGDEMTEALQAISGVAAMTGSEYSDIARIFTTVAGNGKVMTQQLNQLGGRGLNVAAKMAEAFGVTEEEFRAMVSDKDTIITFKDFYKATSSYFEQAAKANNLYTGALSNMKSALSRIGQPVMTQWYESARDVLNAVRPWVNTFKKSITPLYDFIEERMKTLTGKITEPFLAAFNDKGELLKPEIAENFAKIGDIIQNVLEGIWNIGSLVFGVIKNIKDAFTEVFGSDIINMILQVTQKFKEFTAMLSGANDVADKSSALYGAVPAIMKAVKTIATGLFTVIKSIKDVIGSIFNIVSPLFINIVVPLFNFISSVGLTVLARVSSYVSKLFGLLKNVKGINVFGTTVEGALKTAGEAINKFSGTAVEKINWFFDNIDKLPDLFKKLWNNVKTFFTKNLGGLSKFFQNFSAHLKKFKKEAGDSSIIASLKKLGTAIKEFFSNLTLEKVFGGFVKAFTSVKDVIKSILDFLSPVVTKLVELVKFLAKSVVEALGGKAGENLLSGGILAVVFMLLKRMKDMKELVKTFKSFKEGALDVLKKFGNILKSYQNSIDAKNLQTLAIAIGILAGSIVALSLVDTKKVVQVSGILMVLGGALSWFLKTFKKTEQVKSASNIVAEATQTIAGGVKNFLTTLGSALSQALTRSSWMLALDLFAFAILEIAGAIRMLTSVNWKEAWPSTLAILGVIGGMMAIFERLQHLSTKLKGNEVKKLMASSAALAVVAVSFGVSMLAMSTAVLIFGLAWKTNQGGFIAGIVAMTTLIVTIGYASKLMGNIQSRLPSLIGMAAAIVAMSASMTLMALGLAALAGAFALMNNIGEMAILKGVTVLVAMLGAIAIAGRYANGSWKEILAMGIMAGAFAGAMLVLSGAFAIVAALEKGVGAFVIVMASFAGVMALFGMIGSKWGNNIVKVGKAFALFGVGALAFSAAVTLVIAAIMALQAMGPVIQAVSAGLAVALTTFFTTLSSLSGPLSKAVGNIAASLVNSLLTSLKNTLGPAIKTVAKMLVQTLDTLNKYAPELIDKLVTLLVTVFNKLTTRIPELVDSLWDFVAAFVGAVKDKLKDLPNINVKSILAFTIGMGFIIKWFASMKKKAKDALPMVGIIGLILIELVAAFAVMDSLDAANVAASAVGMSAVVVAIAASVGYLAKLKVSVAAAAKAAAAIGVAAVIFAVAFDVIVAVIGGLMIGLGAAASEWESMIPFLQKGVEVMGIIGAGIGEFFGNLAAGLLSGIGEGLEQIGQSLSNFWTNAQVFFDGLKTLDDQAVEAAEKLALVLLILGGAELLDAISKLLGGETNYEALAEQLVAFAGAIVGFGNVITENGLDSTMLENIKTAAEASEALAAVANLAPKEGGLWEKIAGKTDLGKFGESLRTYGECLVSFSESVNKLAPEDYTNIQTATDISKELVELNKNVPLSDGIWQLIAGNHDLDKFGEKLSAYAMHLKTYCWFLGNQNGKAIDENDVKLSKLAVKIGKQVTEFNKTIVPSGGIWDLIGNQDLSKFASSMKDYADGLMEFVKKARKIKSNDVYTTGFALAIGESINKVSIGSKDKKKNLNNFTEGVKKFADAMVYFSDKVKDLDIEPFKLGYNAAWWLVPTIVALANAMSTEGAGKLTKKGAEGFAAFLEKSAEGLKLFSEGVLDIDFSNFAVSIENVQKIAESLNSFNADSANAFANAMKEIANASVDQFTAEFSTKAPYIMAVVEAFFSQLKALIEEQAKPIRTASNTVSLNITKGLASGYVAAGLALRQFLQGLINLIANRDESFSKSGYKSMKKYAEGMQSEKSVENLRKVSINIGKAATTAIENKDGMYDAGVNAIKGFLWGAVSKVEDGTVNKVFTNIGIEALKAAMKALAEKSPSRKFMEVGENAVLGLVIGVQDNIKRVYDEGTNIGQTLYGAFKNASTNVSDLITDELDLDPTITPVVDLSQLQNGIYGANLLLNGIHTSPIHLAGNNIDQIVSLEGNRYNDANVIKAIDDLNTKLDDLSMQLANLQIVLDSGALVGGLAPGLNKNFGKMDMLTQRGVM